MLGRALSQGLSLGRLAFQGHRIVSQARNRGSSRQGLHLSLLQLLLPASNQGLSHLLHFSVFPTSAASPLAFYCKSVSFFYKQSKKDGLSFPHTLPRPSKGAEGPGPCLVPWCCSPARMPPSSLPKLCPQIHWAHSHLHLFLYQRSLQSLS